MISDCFLYKPKSYFNPSVVFLRKFLEELRGTSRDLLIFSLNS